MEQVLDFGSFSIKLPRRFIRHALFECYRVDC